MTASVIWALALPTAAVVHGEALISGRRIASDLIYVAGAVLCHQRPERSFQLAGQPLPVCARCTGIYGGAALAAMVFVAAGSVRVGPRGLFLPRRSDVRRMAVCAALPTALTLMWEWITGSAPSNLLRAAAGVPLGVLVSWLVVAAGWRTMPSG
jgi:uncharacterized membrane protein